VLHNTKTGILQFDLDIDKTELALQKASEIARERIEHPEMGEERRITLGDYERLDHLE